MPSSSFRRSALQGFAVFRRRRVLEASFLATSIIVPIVVGALGLGMLLRFSPLGGWLVPLLALLGLGWGFLVAIRFGRRHHLSYPEFLRHLERRLDLRENELVNADDLEAQIPRLHDPLSAGLADLSVEQGRRGLAETNFRGLAPSLSLRRPLLFSGGALVVAAVLAAVAPLGFLSSASRLWRPGSYDLPPALLIQVEPGDATVERGSVVPVRARFPRAQSEVRLVYRAAAGAWKNLPMSAATGDDSVSANRSAGSWACAADLPSLIETTEYAVVSGSARSRNYHLQVVEALRATGYRTRLTFPEYTGLAPVQELRSEGNIVALLGSRVALTVFPSRPEAQGRLLKGDGEVIPLVSTGQGELTAQIPVRGPMEYRVELTSPSGHSSPWLSETYGLEVVPDRAPTLAQLAPDKSIRLPPEMSVQLDIDCLDDFGLTRLDLIYHRNDDPPQKVNLSRWQGNRQARVLYPWLLEGIPMVPGDRIVYHLELTDNDAVSGPKTTVGPDAEIRFPSFDEMYAALKDERGEQVQDVREVMDKQKQLSKDLQKVSDELKQEKNLRWEQQEQVKDLAARQKQVAEEINNLSQSLEKSLDRMEQANLFTPDMLEKVRQINQLVRDIQSPSFRDYLEKMQQAMDRLDRNAVNQTLQNLQVSQQDLERNLDRTLEMLKQLQREEKLDALIRQAERLQEEQKRLNDQMCGKKSEEPPSAQDRTEADNQKKDEAEKDLTQKEDPENGSKGQQDGDRKDDKGSEKKSDQKGEQKSEAGKKDSEKKNNQEAKDAAGECSNKPMNKEEAAATQQKQQALQEELKKLQKQLEELRKEAEQKWQELSKQMQEKQSEASLSSASQNMQKAGQSAGSCQRKESLQFGRKAEQDMQNFAQGMKQAQAAMKGADLTEVTRKLYALCNGLVHLSSEQEALISRAPARSTRELAVGQMQLAEAAKKTLDQLYELGRQSRFITPELGRVMGTAVRRIGDASGAYSLGDRGTGISEGRASADALDETVLALLNASQQMCNSSCSGGSPNPLSRMRSLSGQQESLNQDMQQMMGQQAGGKKLSNSGGSAEDQLLQMAARQEMIQRGLAEVQQSAGTHANILGRLDDIGKDMGDVVQEMKNRNVDERILRKQERILSRLLTAQRSLRKEGDKEERVSRTGINPDNRVSPPAVPDGPTWQEALRRAVLRGSQDPVPSDFRRLVETYFRSLGEQK